MPITIAPAGAINQAAVGTILDVHFPPRPGNTTRNHFSEIFVSNPIIRSQQISVCSLAQEVQFVDDPNQTEDRYSSRHLELRGRDLTNV